MVASSKIASFDLAKLRKLIDRLARYRDFSQAIDPSGEHAFGVFDLEGATVVFQIAMEPATRSASWSSEPSPAERVLTIMLAEEYAAQTRAEARLRPGSRKPSRLPPRNPPHNAAKRTAMNLSAQSAAAHTGSDAVSSVCEIGSDGVETWRSNGEVKCFIVRDESAFQALAGQDRKPIAQLGLHGLVPGRLCRIQDHVRRTKHVAADDQSRLQRRILMIFAGGSGSNQAAISPDNEQSYCCRKDWRLSAIGALLSRPGAITALVSELADAGLKAVRQMTPYQALIVSVSRRYRCVR